MSRNSRSRPWSILMLVLSTVVGSVLAPQLWKVNPPQTAQRPVKDLRRHLSHLKTADKSAEQATRGTVENVAASTDGRAAEESLTLNGPSLALEMLRPTASDSVTTHTDHVAVALNVDATLPQEPEPHFDGSASHDVPAATQSESTLPELPRPDPTFTNLADMGTPSSFVTPAPSVTSQYETTRATKSRLNPVSANAGITPRMPKRLVPETDKEEIDHQLATYGEQVAKQPASIVPQVESCWPLPVDLLENIQPFAQDARTADWHQQVIQTLKQLNALDTVDDPTTAALFSELQALLAQAKVLARQAGVSYFSSQLLRARYALERRLSMWQGIHRAATQIQLVSVDKSKHRPSVDRCAMILEAQLQNDPNGRAWREYLMLDKIHRYAQPNTAVSAEWRQQLAQDVLWRINSPQLSTKQQQLMQSEPFANLGNALQTWATSPVDYLQLVDELERFELHRRPSDSRHLAEYHQRLRWAPAPAANALARQLDSHYRNANIRVAMSVTLMNNMLPQPETVEKGVKDFILGSRVFGTSHTAAKLHLTLVPHPQRLQMVLNAAGTVDSNTRSLNGPASFRNRGNATYAAQKLFSIHPQGIQAAKATAEAEGTTRLLGIQTDYDDIPLISSLARTIAEQEYDEQSARANRIMERRIEQQVAFELDREATAQVLRAKDSFQQKILTPLQKRNLNPQALHLETTEQRAIIRYRIAGHHQLAAYTPRPQAPADSLLSVQVHQSAINNTLSSLGLAGNEFTLVELIDHLKSTFNLLELDTPQDLPEGVVVRFANHDPVRVLLKEGEVKIVLKLSKVATPTGRRWTNFYVLATYRPQNSRVAATLVRDDVISIAGSRIGFGERVALQAIFNKVFSQDRPIELLPEEFTRQRGFENARLNQFICTDGWLGLAVGPESGYVSRRQPSTTR